MEVSTDWGAQPSADVEMQESINDSITNMVKNEESFNNEIPPGKSTAMY